MPPWPAAALETTVTWIKVERPTLDLVGIVLGALSVAGLCAIVALLLGVLLGFVRIRRIRSRPAVADRVALHLD